MQRLFRFPSAPRRDPAVEAWRWTRGGETGALARRWFERLRVCGDDVREVMHDGQPTACVGDAAFAYVDAFRAHVNVGFFLGTELPDPAGLLQGSGRFMRHVKLAPGRDFDAAALGALVQAAYADVHGRLSVSR
ncbi:MAG: DUF1801 domain-containing protein [Burkholderiaceae bacterium]